MSNHFSGPNLKFPGDDARLDITDLYVFQSPQNRDATVLVVDVNPLMTGSEFHPDAVYRINIDNNADALPDVTFTFTFTPPVAGAQAGTVYHATGPQARQLEPAGEVLVRDNPVGFGAAAQAVQAGRCRLFTGVRSDPFFADVEGYLHGFEFTGDDLFSGKNVLAIVLEVPNDMLGDDPCIGVWAEASVRRDGVLVQVDRGGQPSTTPFLNIEEAKAAYNAGHPVDDLVTYLTPWTERLQELGGYSMDDATAAVRRVLPDILRFDRTRPAIYPNGRNLTDDVFDTRMAFLSQGKYISDGVGPHDDLLAEFPYLGVPNISGTDGDQNGALTLP
jgi:hypothetical protein